MRDFSVPFEVTSSMNVRDLLPGMFEIPDEYVGRDKWENAVSTWFFKGMRKDAFVEREGIDRNKAFNHLAAIISSWDLKHEHKTAGAAYLMSLWFLDVTFK